MRRRIDEAEFQLEKTRKEGEFSLQTYKISHEADAKNIFNDNIRLTQRLKETQADLSQIRGSYEVKLQAKETENANQKVIIQGLTIRIQNELLQQKKFYQDKIAVS